MRRHTHHRRLLAPLATGAVLAALAPAATAMPVDNSGPPATPVKVVRVQVDEGLDWTDAGIGAAGMLAFVLVGVGGIRTATFIPTRKRSTAQS
jgi:hypothetical protein